MLEKIFSEKNRMADNGILCKTLYYDITRQARVPAAIVSMDASNFYDKIPHAVASLVLQAYGVPTLAMESMLGTIENMKFFLPGFGDSTGFVGGGISIKTQGMYQGNGQHLQDRRSSAFAFSMLTARKGTVQNLCAQSPN
jgi:hypothetical protein